MSAPEKEEPPPVTCAHGVPHTQGCIGCAEDFTNATEEAMDRWRVDMYDWD